MGTSSGSFINNGTVNLFATHDLPTGSGVTYMPIAVGDYATQFQNNGIFNTYGGTWDAATGVFTPEGVTERTTSDPDDMLRGRRLSFGSNRDMLAQFRPDLDQNYTVNHFDAEEVIALEIDGKFVLAAYDFNTTVQNSDVLLSFKVGSNVNPEYFTFLHRDEGETTWNAFTPTFSHYDGTYIHFNVSDFSSYAVTIPEPTTALLLSIGSLVLLRRRR